MSEAGQPPPEGLAEPGSTGSTGSTQDGGSRSDPHPKPGRARYPTTPDKRYFLVAGRLWRSTDPALSEDQRELMTVALMKARRAVKDAKRGAGNLGEARAAVDKAKIALGERGPVWWTDGAPDFNRHLVKNTPYAEWAAQCRDRGSRDAG